MIWKWLGRTRYHFEGLQLGRDSAGDAWGDKLTFLAKRRWGIVQVDRVSTPWRAHQRDQAKADCQTCGGAVADWKHLLWECGEVVRNPQKKNRELVTTYQVCQGQPRCLWLLGIVPRGWLPGDRQEQAKITWDCAVTHWGECATWVCTDGGCRNTPCGPRAGYGVYCTKGAIGGLVPGPEQLPSGRRSGRCGWP